MEVIVLDDSDESDQNKDSDGASYHSASARHRPAKRRRQDSSTTHVSDTVNISADVSHVSDTVLEPSATEAPIMPAATPSTEGESPTLSPQQVRSVRTALHLQLLLSSIVSH